MRTTRITTIREDKAMNTTAKTTIRTLLQYPLIALSFGAAAIHAAVTGDHFHEAAILGVAFTALTAFQLAWGAVLMTRLTARILVVGAVVNAGAIGAWALSRTIGLPVGDTPWVPEPVGAVDVICVALEAVLVVGALVAATGSSLRRSVTRSTTAAVAATAALLVTGCAAAAVAAPSGESGMGGMGDMGAPAATTGTGGPAMGASAMSPGSGMSMPSGGSTQQVPGHTGMEMDNCTAPVTAAQQAGADQLYAQTRAGIAQYSTIAAATAAGYTPETNASAPIVHWLNPTFVKDGDVLDPSHPAALMFAKTATGEQLVGAMFLAAPGQTTGPQPGGCLTQWHLHTNLCFSSTTHRVAGNTDATGTCAAGSVNTISRAMMHVWTVPVSGGPFAMDLTQSDISSILHS